MENVMLNRLHLACFPMSNQLADLLWGDAEFRKLVTSSKLYMIGQRAEVLFENIVGDAQSNTLMFDLVSGNTRATGVSLPMSQIDAPIGALDIEGGARHLKFYSEVDGDRKLVRWFTPDRILFEHWRNNITLEGLTDIRPFTRFDLHYVGISKEGDSFSRLFRNGHEKRAKILSNAKPITPGARVTDEVVLFLFDIEDIRMKSWAFGEIAADHTVLTNGTDAEYVRVVADAEKAFVKILNADYNAEKYNNYPHGSDGLHSSGLQRYGYFIDEPISFDTHTGGINGGHFFSKNPPDIPDLIFVTGDIVALKKFDDNATQNSRTPVEVLPQVRPAAPPQSESSTPQSTTL
jgi:hypothetical protein